MHALKQKIKDDTSFSPWEESFINLAKKFKSTKQLKPKKLPQLSLEYYQTKPQYRSVSVKKILNRPLLTLSRVNLKSLQNDTPKIRQQTINTHRVYEGPRITFYSKMNPKCSERSKITYSVRNLLNPQKLTIIDTNSSIQIKARKNQKYLIVQPKFKQTLIKDSSFLQISNKNVSRSKKRKYYATKTIDSNQTMKRLKLLYNFRKLVKFD